MRLAFEGKRHGRTRSCGTRAGTDLRRTVSRLLGDDADSLTDEEVLVVVHHAESLAHVLIELALQDVRIH